LTINLPSPKEGEFIEALTKRNNSARDLTALEKDAGKRASYVYTPVKDPTIVVIAGTDSLTSSGSERDHESPEKVE